MSLKGISETSFQDRLAKYVESGDITPADYEKLIEQYNATHRKKKEWDKKKIKKIAYATLCIILALLLASVAVLYHKDAIETAYNEGKDAGYSRGYKTGYNKGYGYYEKIRDEYNFYHKYAVITASTGKKYHRHNCYHIADRKFYIYNISAAKSEGYTACLDCFEKSSFEEIAEKYGVAGTSTKKK